LEVRRTGPELFIVGLGADFLPAVLRVGMRADLGVRARSTIGLSEIRDAIELKTS
jgi:hypothetical protein